MPQKNIYILISAIVAYFILCLVTNAYLKLQVPVSQQDLNHTSWLISYSVATHFAASKLGALLAVVSLVIGAALSFAKKNIMPLIGGCVWLGFIVTFGNVEHTARLAYIYNGAKIGCYVEDMRECKAMLGVGDSAARSMYSENGKASWYIKARGKFAASGEYNAFPGVMFIALPYKMLSVEISEVNERLKRQRARVGEILAEYTEQRK